MNISFYLLPKAEVAHLYKEDNVGNALRIMNRHGYQALPVIDAEGRYWGTVTEGDFLWNLIREYHMDYNTMRKTCVENLRLRWDYRPVSIEADIRALDEAILNQNFVPVVDGRGVFIGIVTRKAIMQVLLKDKEHTAKAGTKADK